MYFEILFWTEYCGDPRSNGSGAAGGGGSLLARASLPEVSGRPSVEGTPPPPPMSHLDLVRSGAASAETELQQRASLLAVDNANLRTQVGRIFDPMAGFFRTIFRRIEGVVDLPEILGFWRFYLEYRVNS